MAETIYSIGIDAGTSTSQTVLSSFLLENHGGYFSVPQVAFAERQVLWQSEIHETPLRSAEEIDAPALRALVAADIAAAQPYLNGHPISTGAVIITGETARKSNADAVLKELSGFAGDFVAATAGPDLESELAGRGSGAAERSKTHKTTVVNFDIGGGTTNVAVFRKGELVGVTCFDIGGRHIRFDSENRIIYMSATVRRLIKAHTLRVEEGKTAAEETLKRIAHAMTDVLFMQEDAYRTKGAAQLSAPVKALLETDAEITFSGGVADCIYNNKSNPYLYGDFGVFLGQAIRESRLFGKQTVKPRETIRATVTGAGMYSVTLSGSTIGYADASVFPLKNLPVFTVTPEKEELLWSGKGADELGAAFAGFLAQNDTDNAVLYLEGKANPGYMELDRLARSVAQVFAHAIRKELPRIVVFFHDIAKAAGQLLRRYMENGDSARKGKVVALDRIRVDARNYLDIGRPLMGGLAVPVVVKTLLLG
ncbi:MAG: ethanolamine ammonia-lyase reactivating factor EutA [Oscillospiraceae bacterium]|jgi:ethanolamine utilization protein EutA|nr:ethanolamine ammonia-lyase reactivating factor EutA [Oscillospiraceae bacterium]